MTKLISYFFLFYAITASAKSLLISSWFGPGPALNTTKHLKLVHDLGITHVGPRTWHPVHHPFFPETDYQTFLDNCEAVGLKGFLVDPRLMPTGNGDLDLSGIKAVVDRFSTHSALSHYLVYDEPSSTQFEVLRKITQQLEELDPKHPAFINLFPNYVQLGAIAQPSYEKYLEEFTRIFSPAIPGGLPMLSVDHYPFLKKGTRSKYLANLRIIQEKAKIHGMEPWLTIQAWESKHHDLPHEGQLKWQAYQALAHGFSGIFYFTLYAGTPSKEAILTWGGTPGPLFESVRLLNHRIRRIGDVLVNLEHIETVHQGIKNQVALRPLGSSFPLEVLPHTASVSIGRFLDPVTKRDYYLIVNGSYSHSQSITLREKFGHLLVAKERGRKNDGKTLYHLSLAPGEGYLVRASSEK